MVAEEPKNEQGVCKAVMCLIADRRAERIIKAEPVDSVVRDRPAVEWVFDTPTARFVVENTRIESFQNQIATGKSLAQLLEPLETELVGKLPGADNHRHASLRGRPGRRDVDVVGQPCGPDAAWTAAWHVAPLRVASTIRDAFLAVSTARPNRRLQPTKARGNPAVNRATAPSRLKRIALEGQHSNPSLATTYLLESQHDKRRIEIAGASS
jgi:hypothetical protein